MQIDNGLSIVKYDEEYWKNEQGAAKERSYGSSLARMAEVIFYTRIPIRKFIDIGTGQGHFLDSIAKYLPEHVSYFYGCEKFPPSVDYYRSPCKNYIPVFLDEIDFIFEAGMCIEVIEHLTPTMLKSLFIQLNSVASKGSFFLFNTGTSDFIMLGNDDYLDPVKRGHIVSYSLKGIATLLNDTDFVLVPIKGKSWAFGIEKLNDRTDETIDIEHRIWNPVLENMEILNSKSMGNVLKILGIESSRAYW